MFDYTWGMGMQGGTTREVRAAADAAAATALSSLADARRAENRCAAAVVRSVHDLTELRFATEMDVHHLGEDEADIALARRTVECEAAVALSLSRMMTRDLLTVGAQLAWRLPRVSAAFDEGDLDYPRARAIALTLEKASDTTVAALEESILSAALRMNTRALEENIWRAWFEHDAAEASAARKATESEERCAEVKRGDDGTATLIAKMSTLEGAECNSVLEELIGTVCSRDPRTKKQLRGFALLALFHREDYILCTCGRAECPVRSTERVHKDRRPHLLQIMIDIKTLLGLTNEPATLGDGTVLDPEIARHIAGSAEWQILLTELLDAAHHATAATDRTAEARVESDDASPQHNTDGNDGNDGNDGDSDTDGPGDSGGPGVPSGPDVPSGPVPRVPSGGGASEGPRAVRLLRRGKIRSAAPLPSRESASANRTTSSKGRHRDIDLSKYIQCFLSASAQDSSLTRGVHPDGHGGFLEPPPGALTYRPSAELVALTRATHCTCTFPGCSVPSERCEIDHVVPFDHNDPIAGGWTVRSNLQPLCKYHHQAKTLKLWTAAVLAGDAIYWVSTSGLRHITPSTFGTVVVPATFRHTSKHRMRPESWIWNSDRENGMGYVVDPCDLDDSAQPMSADRADTAAAVERVPSDALYEPTWWEMHISVTDSTWSKVANMNSPMADGTIRIPSLGDIARMTDTQDREDATFIRRMFVEHRTVIAARETRNYRAPF